MPLRVITFHSRWLIALFPFFFFCFPLPYKLQLWYDSVVNLLRTSAVPNSANVDVELIQHLIGRRISHVNASADRADIVEARQRQTLASTTNIGKSEEPSEPSQQFCDCSRTPADYFIFCFFLETTSVTVTVQRRSVVPQTPVTLSLLSSVDPIPPCARP